VFSVTAVIVVTSGGVLESCVVSVLVVVGIGRGGHDLRHDGWVDHLALVVVVVVVSTLSTPVESSGGLNTQTDDSDAVTLESVGGINNSSSGGGWHHVDKWYHNFLYTGPGVGERRSSDVLQGLGEVVSSTRSETSSHACDSVLETVWVVGVVVDMDHLRYGVMVSDHANSDVLVIYIPLVNTTLDEVALVVNVKVTVSSGVLDHEHDLSGVAGNVVFVRNLSWAVV